MYTLSEKLGWTIHNSYPRFSRIGLPEKYQFGSIFKYSHVTPHFKGDLMLITKTNRSMGPK